MKTDKIRWERHALSCFQRLQSSSVFKAECILLELLEHAIFANGTNACRCVLWAAILLKALYSFNAFNLCINVYACFAGIARQCPDQFMATGNAFDCAGT